MIFDITDAFFFLLTHKQKKVKTCHYMKDVLLDVVIMTKGYPEKMIIHSNVKMENWFFTNCQLMKKKRRLNTCSNQSKR